MGMAGGRAAAARNVSSTTRVDNSQSSRGTAAFSHPRLWGTEGQGELGNEDLVALARPVEKEFGPKWVSDLPHTHPALVLPPR